MEMKEKRAPAWRGAWITMALCLIMTCAVFGSIAGHTVDADSPEPQLPVNLTMEFDLFGTVNEADTNSNEADVGNHLVAPGTGGSYIVKVANPTDGIAVYSLVLTETNEADVPIQYSIDGATWYDDFADINAALDRKPINGGVTKNITVYWRWSYEGRGNGTHAGQTDKGDTSLGAAASNGTVSVIVEAVLTISG